MRYVKHTEHPIQSKLTETTHISDVAQRARRLQATPGCQLSVTSHDLSFNHLGKISDQLQSSFCSHLSREIRLKIYKHLLGERRLHVLYGDGVKRSYLCRYACILETFTSDRDHFIYWNQYKPSLDSLLPLLQSCRRVYVPLARYMTCPRRIQTF